MNKTQRLARIEEALHSGLLLMDERGETFSDQDVLEWRLCWQDELVPALVAELYDPEDEPERQWLIISVLGSSGDATLWSTIIQAYHEGDEHTSALAEWAMMEMDGSRFWMEEFFRALASFAEEEIERRIEEGPYQPMLL